MRIKIIRNKLVFGITLLFISQVFLPLLAAQTIDMQESKGKRIITQDDTPPEISDVNYPYVVTVPSSIIISAIVTDDVAVETVKLIIEFPSYTFNLTMINTPSTNKYNFESTAFLQYEYKFWIWASDTSGNTKSSPIYTIDGQLSSSHPDVGFLGEVSVVWKWKGYLPGVAYINIVKDQNNKSTELNCTNGYVVIDNISFAYIIYFDLFYNFPRLAIFQLACYYDKNCSDLIPNAIRKWPKSATDGYYSKPESFKNLSIRCDGLDSRIIYCKLTVAPRLMFTFLPWLEIQKSIIVEILVKFNYP